MKYLVLPSQLLKYCWNRVKVKCRIQHYPKLDQTHVLLFVHLFFGSVSPKSLCCCFSRVLGTKHSNPERICYKQIPAFIHHLFYSDEYLLILCYCHSFSSFCLTFPLFTPLFAVFVLSLFYSSLLSNSSLLKPPLFRHINS